MQHCCILFFSITHKCFEDISFKKNNDICGNTKASMIEATEICKSYGALRILSEVSLSVQQSEFLCITGSSGAGKSTLLHILATLDTADKGSVYLDGVNTKTLKGNRLAKFRNQRLGMVFQAHNLLPEFTALENICMPALLGGLSKTEAEKKARELMQILDVWERASHKPSELSGGEQQRISVGRALINSPKIVFADEPSGNLDEQNAKELHDLFFLLREKFGQTFVVVTHNPLLAKRADRVFEIKKNTRPVLKETE